MTFKDVLEHAASLKGWTEQEQRDVLLEYLEQGTLKTGLTRTASVAMFEAWVKNRMKKAPKK